MCSIVSPAPEPHCLLFQIHCHSVLSSPARPLPMLCTGIATICDGLISILLTLQVSSGSSQLLLKEALYWLRLPLLWIPTELRAFTYEQTILYCICLSTCCFFLLFYECLTHLCSSKCLTQDLRGQVPALCCSLSSPCNSGSWLGIQNLRPHPTPIQSETALEEDSRWYTGTIKFEKNCSALSHLHYQPTIPFL